MTEHSYFDPATNLIGSTRLGVQSCVAALGLGPDIANHYGANNYTADWKGILQEYVESKPELGLFVVSHALSDNPFHGPIDGKDIHVAWCNDSSARVARAVLLWPDSDGRWFIHDPMSLDRRGCSPITSWKRKKLALLAAVYQPGTVLDPEPENQVIDLAESDEPGTVLDPEPENQVIDLVSSDDSDKLEDAEYAQSGKSAANI